MSIKIIHNFVFFTLVSNNPIRVTRPEHPKGTKDEVKQAQRAATQKPVPGWPLDF